MNPSDYPEPLVQFAKVTRDAANRRLANGLDRLRDAIAEIENYEKRGVYIGAVVTVRNMGQHTADIGEALATLAVLRDAGIP